MSGVEVELGGFIDLSDKVGRIHDKMMRGYPKAMYKPFGNNATGTAPLTVEVGTQVPPGQVVNLLGVGLFGADGHTTLAGAVADVYIASSGVALPDFSCQVLAAQAVPSVYYWSKEVLWVLPTERLVAIVYGFAGTQTVTMIARGGQYPLEAKVALSA